MSLIQAIYIDQHPAWYCQKCHTSHNVLYVNGKKHYCTNCVSEDVKKKAVYMNQNREPIEYNKI